MPRWIGMDILMYPNVDNPYLKTFATIKQYLNKVLGRGWQNIKVGWEAVMLSGDPLKNHQCLPRCTAHCFHFYLSCS